MAYHGLGQGRQALVINFVDEASTFHIADVVKEGQLSNTGKDTHSVLGNVNAETLLLKYHNSWARYFGHPVRIHVDADGVFNSDFFKKYVGAHHRVIYPCAGEAHWQHGLIERHIQTDNRSHQNLLWKSNSAT